MSNSTDYVTKQDLEEFGSRLEAKIDSSIEAKIDKAVIDISRIITDFIGHTDERFVKVETRLNVVEQEQAHARDIFTMNATGAGRQGGA